MERDGSDEMKTWKSEPWAVLDLETTGLQVETAKIWEIGIRFRGCEGGRTVQTLVNPECEIPAEIVEKCGLTPELLERIRQAPTFSEIAERLLRHLSGKLLVGQNILAYDRPIVQTELGRIWLDPSALDVPAADTLVGLRRLHPELRSRQLSDVAKAWGIPGSSEAHRTAADVYMAEEILVRLRDRLPDDLDELLTFQAQWAAHQAADFERYSYWLRTDDSGELFMACGKHCGLPLRAVDPGYLEFMLCKQHEWKDGQLPPAVDEVFRRYAGGVR
jgi:DNA polymerase-3 subunit epsilon